MLLQHVKLPDYVTPISYYYLFYIIYSILNSSILLSIFFRAVEGLFFSRVSGCN